jgi:hypothetical protein
VGKSYRGHSGQPSRVTKGYHLGAWDFTLLGFLVFVVTIVLKTDEPEPTGFTGLMADQFEPVNKANRPIRYQTGRFRHKSTDSVRIVIRKETMSRHSGT